MKQFFRTTFLSATITLVAVVAVAQTNPSNMPTRFGPLTVNTAHLLGFRGQLMQPKVEGNNSLTFVRKFELKGRDVVLLQDNGGTACPALYRFVSVNRRGARVTSAFGTCSDLLHITRQRETIIVDMPALEGPFATKTERDRAIGRRHYFVFKDGIVKQLATKKAKKTRN